MGMTGVNNFMSDRNATRFVIIDDDHAVRRMIGRTIHETFSDEPAEFASPSEALDYTALNREVAVVLIDWHIGELDGTQWIAPLTREWPAAAFIVMSADADPRGYLAASQTGRIALWWRKTDSTAMLASLMSVALDLHGRLRSGEAFRTLADIKDTAIRGAVANHRGDLKAAAKELGVSVSTIRRHLSSN